MRPIKFRGKRKDSGEWIFGYYDGYRQLPVIRMEDGYCAEVDPETVGEFTGLHDKHGTEIYEGDICRIVGSQYFLGAKEICWRDGRYYWGNSLVILCDMECKNMEVIGNIHENPDLIKEQS